jgi:hypothetical protein|tara:strand:- start:999 stop:1214 length:216 start_codon:yes stop_codon:yes gene_type:complete
MDIPDAFTVVVPSAINNAELMLGWGRSEQAALEDAFGPKPWTSYQRRSARNATVRNYGPLSDYELNEVIHG